MSLIEELQQECDYDPEGDSPVDNLIAYKDALEDLVGQVDSILLCNSGHPAAVKYRNASDFVYLSAADVCGALFEKGFGETP